MTKFLKMRWLINKRVGWTILWTSVLVLVASVVNVLGIRFAGDIQHWNTWLKDQALVFLIWRVVLYIAVAGGWIWMRQRILTRETTPESKMRFIRIEIAAVVALLTLEISNWLA